MLEYMYGVEQREQQKRAINEDMKWVVLFIKDREAIDTLGATAGNSSN